MYIRGMKSKPNKKRVNYRLDPELAKWIDDCAQSQGVTRTKVVESALGAYNRMLRVEETIEKNLSENMATDKFKESNEINFDGTGAVVKTVKIQSTVKANFENTSNCELAAKGMERCENNCGAKVCRVY